MQSFIIQFVLFFCCMFTAFAACAAPPSPAFTLYSLGFYGCCAVSIMIFCILIYSSIRFRKIKKAHFHRNLAVEILWTLLAFAIFIALLIPAAIIASPSHGNCKDQTKIGISCKASYHIIPFKQN